MSGSGSHFTWERSLELSVFVFYHDDDDVVFAFCHSDDACGQVRTSFSPATWSDVISFTALKGKRRVHL